MSSAGRYAVTSLRSATLDVTIVTTAFDQLEDWIKKSPSERSCWTIDRLGGKWRVGLTCGDERYSAAQAATLAEAVTGAITIATMAGCL